MWSQQFGLARAIDDSHIGAVSPGTDEGAMTLRFQARRDHQRQRHTIFPTRPVPLNKQEHGIRPAPSADSVDQAHAAVWKLLGLPQREPTTTFRCRKERLSFTGDQRINDKAELIHQPGIDKASRNLTTAHEIDVVAGLLLEGSDLFESRTKIVFGHSAEVRVLDRT